MNIDLLKGYANLLNRYHHEPINRKFRKHLFAELIASLLTRINIKWIIRIHSHEFTRLVLYG